MSDPTQKKLEAEIFAEALGNSIVGKVGISQLRGFFQGESSDLEIEEVTPSEVEEFKNKIIKKYSKEDTK